LFTLTEAEPFHSFIRNTSCKQNVDDSATHYQYVGGLSLSLRSMLRHYRLGNNFPAYQNFKMTLLRLLMLSAQLLLTDITELKHWLNLSWKNAIVSVAVLFMLHNLEQLGSQAFSKFMVSFLQTSVPFMNNRLTVAYAFSSSKTKDKLMT